jgi:copper chaperone
MSCSGCSGAVERVLKKLPGVTEYRVDLATQRAHVTAEDGLSYETVLDKIKKTGKEVQSGEADGQVMAVA